MLEEQGQEIYFKTIRNHSERIFGAFSGLYYINFQKIFKLDNAQSGIADNIVKFRNDIIHKGKIPTLLESIAYGEAIYNEINDVVQDLRSKYQERIVNHIIKIVSQRAAKLNAKNCITYFDCTIYSIIDYENKLSFREKLNKLEARLKS